ncbi:hypothetical protein B296_00010558 [Ensete ventricosum]|uniref:Uncharacterized protein n=1 Tax=Ensete ventricosum TaxID=4639 RepID=A0A426Z1V0_ENSVE|nr:hypothetical protein B296_00010558 [Ensete ventricosum]
MLSGAPSLSSLPAALHLFLLLFLAAPASASESDHKVRIFPPGSPSWSVDLSVVSNGISLESSSALDKIYLVEEEKAVKVVAADNGGETEVVEVGGGGEES